MKPIYPVYTTLIYNSYFRFRLLQTVNDRCTIKKPTGLEKLQTLLTTC